MGSSTMFGCCGGGILVESTASPAIRILVFYVSLQACDWPGLSTWPAFHVLSIMRVCEKGKISHCNCRRSISFLALSPSGVSEAAAAAYKCVEPKPSRLGSRSTTTLGCFRPAAGRVATLTGSSGLCWEARGGPTSPTAYTIGGLCDPPSVETSTRANTTAPRERTLFATSTRHQRSVLSRLPPR